MKKILTLLLMVGIGAQVASADVWDDLAKYRMEDKAGLPPEKAHELIVKAPAAEYGAIEEKLIAIIESEDATQEAKWFSCRMLQRIGSEKCIPVLEKLLTEDVMSHYARLTLERMTDSPAAGEALRKGLSKAPEKLKVGIASSLGERGDEKAVKEIARLAESKDLYAAKAALIALGKIGGKDAMKALKKIEVCDGANGALQDARISAARSVKDSRTLEDIYKTAKCANHRSGAVVALLDVDASKGAALAAEALKGDDVRLRNAVLRSVVTVEGPELTGSLVDALSDLPAERQKELITALGRRGDKAAVKAVSKFMDSEDDGISSSAIKALARLGGPSEVKALLGELSKGGERGSAAMTGVTEMTDPGVNGALIALLSDEKLKESAMNCLSARNANDAVPELKKLLEGGDADSRKPVWAALGALAGKDDLNYLMKVSTSSKEKADVRSAKDCMKSICSRAVDKDGCVAVLGSHFDKADMVTKTFILELAAVTGSGKGLDLARKTLKTDDKELYKNTVRAMAAWSDVKPSKDLLELAKNSPDPTIKILALRGFIQMVGKDKDKNLNAVRLEEAKALVTRVEEKRLLISFAQNVQHKKASLLLAGYVNDEDVKAEASAALAENARRTFRQGQAPQEIIAALNTALAGAGENKQLKNNLESAIKKLKE